MQPYNGFHLNRFSYSFSTLYGSKWVATFKSCTGRKRCLGFSTLYGSKWVATGGKLAKSLTSCRFQYPLRVEVGCNVQWRATLTSRPGFSTLYGSKWVATWTGRRACRSENVSVPSTGRSGLQLVIVCGNLYSTPMFQYPLRVEVGCNTTPSTPYSNSLRSFSTLYGSKWVATFYLLSSPPRVACFSTLYGSKWVAT